MLTAGEAEFIGSVPFAVGTKPIGTALRYRFHVATDIPSNFGRFAETGSGEAAQIALGPDGLPETVPFSGAELEQLHGASEAWIIVDADRSAILTLVPGPGDVGIKPC